MHTTLLLSSPTTTKEENIDDLLTHMAGRSAILLNKGIEPIWIANHTPDNHTCLGTILKNEDPDLTFPIDLSEIKEYKRSQAVNWPRDIFQYIEDELYISPDYQSLQQQLETLIRTKRSHVSLFGEGGLFVPLKEHIIYPGLFDFDEDPSFSYIQKPKLPFPLPNPEEDREHRTLLRRISNAHLSNQISFSTTPQDNVLMCVTPEYHAFLEGKIQIFMKYFEPKIHVCPEPYTYQPANHVHLYDGSVLLPKECEETARFLKKNMGENKVIELPTIKGETDEFGGLQCRTNVLPYGVLKPQ